MQFAWIMACVALTLGAGLGLRGLLDPNWASGLLRLKAEEGRPGGFAEFRATFGGLFLFAHAVALLAAVRHLMTGDDVMAVYAGGGLAVLSAAWGGTALGRIVAMARDGADTPFNRASTAFEIVIAAMLAAPWAFGLAFPAG
ncbi:MAG: hypothetical protein GC189_12690 [Alphaproteobacteria bacterium]|nr:hypothetical protein [Alphaproteobacteria bacterium]